MGCFSSANYTAARFSSELALGLCSVVPGCRNPVQAVLWHARRLISQAEVNGPPYNPTVYAPVRSVQQIIEKKMEIEGRLLPVGSEFIIELRKDRSNERKNFTCAHEIAHTFFYEAMPAVKLRTVSTRDDGAREEEMLCDIAAAELLMPMRSFSKIAAEFSPSSASALSLSKTFQTSLTATVIRLMQLGIWNTKFVLWEADEGHLRPRWLARPNSRLTYSPDVTLQDEENSSILQSLKSRQPLTADEWLNFRGQRMFCYADSTPLTRTLVLSALSLRRPAIDYSSKVNTSSLPLLFDCICDGTGWKVLKVDGYNVARKCRAVRHEHRKNGKTNE